MQRRCERNYSSADSYVLSIRQDRGKTEAFDKRDIKVILLGGCSLKLQNQNYISLHSGLGIHKVFSS